MIDALVKEYWETEFPQLVARDEIMGAQQPPARHGLTHIITGMRRCGKTFYLYQRIRALLESGIARERVFYFDFSDDRLKPLRPGIGSEVIESFFRMFPESRKQGAYLFLDEVQELDDWEALLRRLADREIVALTVTGSSSKLSSEEISTRFRGRSQSHEMKPLSFSEYLRFAAAASGASIEGPRSQSTKTEMEGMWERFLEEGGFPQVQPVLGVSRADRISLLQGYMRDVVARDVAERSGREDISLANRIALYALRNTACEFSINAAVAQLGDEGSTAYWSKVNRLVELMEQAYLFHELPEFTFELKSRSTATPKVYANDQGLAWAVSRANQEDVGKRLETAVYLELRRRLSGNRVDSVTSYSCRDGSGRKVDFIVGDALSSEPYALVQVCASIEAPKTRKREIESLSAAMAETGLREGLVLTLRESEDVVVGEGTIHVRPAWSWALDKSGASID